MDNASQSKRPEQGAAQDAHARIAEEAQRAKDAPEPGLNEQGYPAVNALMRSARTSIGNAMPASFVHAGRQYWCRVSIVGAILEVFDAPTTGEPLATTFFGSSDEFGHVPFH